MGLNRDFANFGLSSLTNYLDKIEMSTFVFRQLKQYIAIIDLENVLRLMKILKARLRGTIGRL